MSAIHHFPPLLAIKVYTESLGPHRVIHAEFVELSLSIQQPNSVETFCVHWIVSKAILSADSLTF